MGLQETEAECAAGRTAPRVSLRDIESAIAEQYYFTAAEALNGLDGVPARSHDDQLDTLTICLVVLKNGWTQIGKAAPASKENFDPALGRKLAYEDAIRHLWPLMGFNLRQKLHEAAA
jgi:Phage protein (N4 Gp49/phage Sf6 gene 66) family